MLSTSPDNSDKQACQVLVSQNGSSSGHCAVDLRSCMALPPVVKGCALVFALGVISLLTGLVVGTTQDAKTGAVIAFSGLGGIVVSSAVCLTFRRCCQKSAHSSSPSTFVP